MFGDVPTVFPPIKGSYKGMGELISNAGYKQLRVAESEKFNHITVFLNGGRNAAFIGEDRVKIPSHRGIPFDQVPEMKSEEVTQAVIDGLDSGKYHFVAVNYANGDVVGHLNNFEAKVKCIEADVIRLFSHSSSDDQKKYRSKDSLDDEAKKDPLDQFSNYLIERGFLTEESFDEFRKEVINHVNEAADWALSQADPQAESAMKYVLDLPYLLLLKKSTVRAHEGTKIDFSLHVQSKITTQLYLYGMFLYKNPIWGVIRTYSAYFLSTIQL